MSSQNILVGPLLSSCISLKILLSQTASHAALVGAMYSTSVDDNATVAYCFEGHDMVLELSRKTYPLVLFLSSTHPA